MTFAERLTDYLKKNKISSVKMCEDLGIGKNQLSYWREHGNIPKWNTVEKISNYLNVPINYLIYGDEVPADNTLDVQVTLEDRSDFISFSQVLSKLMQTHGLTNYGLSKEIGIPEATIGRWKNGKSVASGDNLQKLSTYFNVSIDYLLTGEPSEQKNIPLNAEASNGMKENETIRFYTEPAQSQTPFLGVMPTSKPYFAGGQPLDTNTPSPSSEGHSKSQAAAMELDELSSTMLQLFSKLSTLDKCKIISTLEELSNEK